MIPDSGGNPDDNAGFGFLHRRVFGVLTLLLLGGCVFLLGGLPGISTHFKKFLFLYGAAWLLSLTALISLPKGLSIWKLRLWILAPALAYRALLAPMHPGDDMSRYQWEGRIILQGINPYAIPPDHSSLAPLRDGASQNINHKDMTAIYPPGTLLLFASLSGLGGSAVLFKWVFILFDLGTLILVFLLLRTRGVDERWAVLYAFNPVILLSFAGQAHFDSVMLFFMTGALLAYLKGRWTAMYIFFSLAFQIKYFGLLPLPFLLNKENWKRSWVLLPGLVLPFGFFLDSGVGPVFQSLFQFGFHMAHNGSVHGLLQVLSGNLGTATAVCLLAYLIFFFWLIRDKDACPVWKSAAALGGFLLLSPTIHFWYIAWFIPFLCLFPAWPWLILTLTAGLYFTAGKMHVSTGTWYQPGWVAVLQWLPVYGFLVYEAVKFRSRRKSPMTAMASRRVSLIIPVLNAEKTLGNCLENLKELEPGPADVVVSDGGSSDATCRLARKAGANLVKSNPGRGYQIAAGIRAAKGDICVVVHADTRLEQDALQRIHNAFYQDGGLAGGAIGQRFEPLSFPLGFIELLNDFRASLMGIAFGDQVQFFRRDVALERNLVPEIPLMEDVELSLRLRKCGRTIFLWGQSEVSNYKWRGGKALRIWLVIKLLSIYFWRKVTGNRDTGDLYRRYYG